MIMKYEWLHFWKTWDVKLKTIFGEPDNPMPQTNEKPVDDYEWKPGKAIERFNDPAFIENVKKL